MLEQIAALGDKLEDAVASPVGDGDDDGVFDHGDHLVAERGRLTALLEDESELRDELDLLRHGAETSVELPHFVNPDTVRYANLLTSFVAVLQPWVDPPVGAVALKLVALEGHDSRVAEWLALRRACGLSEKAYYLRGLVAHGQQTIDFFKREFPGYSLTDFNCEMQEHNNKLVKPELPPLHPMLCLHIFPIIRSDSRHRKGHRREGIRRRHGGEGARVRFRDRIDLAYTSRKQYALYNHWQVYIAGADQA